MSRYLLVGGLAATMALSGCGGSTKMDSSTPLPIVGTYRSSQIHLGGQDASCPGRIDTDSGDSITCEAEVLVFNSDHTFSDTLGGIRTTKGTWSINGNNLTVNTTEPADEVETNVIQVSLRNNNGTLRFDDGDGSSTDYVRQ